MNQEVMPQSSANQESCVPALLTNQCQVQASQGQYRSETLQHMGLNIDDKARPPQRDASEGE